MLAASMFSIVSLPEVKKLLLMPFADCSFPLQFVETPHLSAHPRTTYHTSELAQLFSSSEMPLTAPQRFGTDHAVCLPLCHHA